MRNKQYPSLPERAYTNSSFVFVNTATTESEVFQYVMLYLYLYFTFNIYFLYKFRNIINQQNYQESLKFQIHHTVFDLFYLT